MFFGITESSRYKRFVNLAEDGLIECCGCGAELAFENLNSLEMSKCPHCETYNLIPLKVKDYWLFEPLGGGGMGSVYKACKCRKPFDVVAVKVLQRKAVNDQERQEALFKEARISNEVGDHPLLVKCLDWGCQGNECFAISEYVEGRRMDIAIDNNGCLPLEKVLSIACDVIEADKHIYECGYLYSDLKPANIIINSEGRAILFDYGLCVTLEDARNPEGDHCPGSPAYVPPERLWGLPEDAYSEIYSLGMVMFTALTGEVFHQAKDTGKMLKRHTSKLQIPVEGKLKAFDSRVTKIVSRMLEQDAEKRYRGFDEVKNDINKLLQYSG